MSRPLASTAPALLGSAAAIACTPDVTAPTIERVEFEDAHTLLVQFSEPLAPTDDVDSTTHFRLAAAFVLDEITVYYDISYHFLIGGGPDQAAGVESPPRHGNSLVARIDRGDDASQLRLTLSYPLEHYVCDELDQAAALDIPSGMHLHYAQADWPRVTDLAGNPLVDEGAWWVRVPGVVTTRPGAFPELDLRLPIPCP